MKKKLIEVAIPLEAINAQAAREKSIRHGHPSTLHLWWARRPLAACRAVLFASLVDDPSSRPDKFPTEDAQDAERRRLFRIIEKLVDWDNIKNEKLYNEAYEEILKSTNGSPPPVLDPFAGGGSIPLEAQRLGLEAHASDLNPVAVLINKALIEIPPRFKDMPPVNPKVRKEYLGERNERVLQRNNTLAKSSGGSEGNISPHSIPSTGRNLRDEIPDHPCSGINFSEHSGRMGAGVPQGESPLSVDSAGVIGGSRNAADVMRRAKMVPENADCNNSFLTGRGEPYAYNDKKEVQRGERGKRVEERGKRAEERGKRVEEREKSAEEREKSANDQLYTHSSILFPNSTGLAEDVRYYGEWMREEAFKKIGRLYPKAKLPDGTEATVIAWIWARTVKCPNPACGVEMPLVRSFELSKKKGKEAWVKPVIRADKKSIRFEVQQGKGDVPEGVVNRNGARCICCGSPAGFPYIRDEGKAGRMGAKMMAIVADGQGGRIYLSPNADHVKTADVPKPENYPQGALSGKAKVNAGLYGLTEFSDLFTPRQLTALVTFSDLVGDAITQAQADALDAGLPADDRGLDAGGNGARSYGEAVGVYLACAVNRLVDRSSTLASWQNIGDKIRSTFGRQALAMVWDYAEANSFCNSTGCWTGNVEWVYKCLQNCISNIQGFVDQQDAMQIAGNPVVISTDPPYYDNIGYADLSDFFYIWLRRSLQNVYPTLFSTLLVPKAEELVATPFRFDGNKEKAKLFFEDGMLKAFKKMRQTVNADFPLTVYYAYKQSEHEADEETESTEIASSGWETMLQAIIKAGFFITGTWPLRTERSSRAVAQNANALASSIAIVCRPRPEDAPSITRRAFQTELRKALKEGLHKLQAVNIAPVDLAQASIGPGIAVYSKYKEILKADDTQMTVHDALVMINQELDEYLSTQTGNLDPNSQFCIAWFEECGLQAAEYGRAETLAKAKLAHIQDLAGEGVLESGRGKVRLTKRSELPENWNIDKAKSIWAMVQGLCLAMDKGGKAGAAAAMAKIVQENPAAVDNIKSLAYRAYMISERKGWNDEALAYNSLVSMWLDISTEMNKIAREKSLPQQAELLLEK
ncbi:putative DNA methylase [Hollandina sp. SP2]